MSDPYVHINPALLDQDFKEKLDGLLAACAAHGAIFRASYGYRSLSEQADLYAKFKAGGPRAAKPGRSAHNYGEAVDLVRVVDGEADWQPGDYSLLTDLAPRYALETGAPYRDYGHVEPAGWRPPPTP